MSALIVVSWSGLNYTEHMFRYLVAYAPTFRLDRCGWSNDQAAVLVAEERNALRVQSCTPRAHSAGIRKGMSVSAARARLPELETELLDPEAESADLHALATQLLRVSPCIAALPPDAMVAEVSRTQNAGSERAMMERIRIRMGQLGHAAHVVIADEPTTALHVARWQQQSIIVAPGGSARALAPLPLHALGIPESEQTLLTSLGIHTVGDFAAVPAASLTGRFSATVLVAHALSCGRAARPSMTPWTEAGTASISQELPAPIVEFEAMTFVVGALVRELSARLTAKGHAATQIELGLRLSNGRSQSIALRLGAPTRDSTAILNRIRHRTNGIKLGGPVVAISLTTSAAAPFDGRQLDLRDPHRRDEAIIDVSARLQDALGSRSVLCARTIPRHRPEGAWRPVPFGSSIPSGPASAAAERAETHGPDPVLAWEGHPKSAIPERPPILLSPPQATEIDTGPNGIPTALHVDGRWHEVTHCTGPEYISGEWWARPFKRIYWQTQLADGRRCWLYNEHERWWLHGWWDR